MSKKRKFNHLIFPVLFIIFPFFVFLIVSVTRYFNTGIFNYANNFIHYYDALKNIKEYIFPAILFLTIGLLYVVISKLAKKKINFANWLTLLVIGLIIIICGNRVLFIVSNNLWHENIFDFILNGINVYSFVLSSQFCFFISSIVYYFENFYLKQTKK